MTSRHTDAPTLDVLPTGHGVHSDAASIENVPAEHCVHDSTVPPLDADPALQAMHDEPDL